MATIILPTMLRSFAGSNEEIAAPGATVHEVLSNVLQQYPELEKQMFVNGRLRSYIRIFLGKQNIRYLYGLETPVEEDAVLRVVPVIGGGSRAVGLGGRIFDLAEEAGGLRLISLEAVQQLEAESGLSRREVELAVLAEGVLPRRYLRSYGTVGIEGQITLLNSTAAVVGLGGLGGGSVEGLARMGVGRIITIDGDSFVDHNFNRQLLSAEAAVGQSKAEAAKARAAAINAAVEVIAHPTYLTEENLESLLAGADVVIDALDRIPTRLILQDGAQRLGIPLVHGAIAGYMGQVMTIFPGDLGLRAFYADEDVPDQGAEAGLGCPAATPMMVSAWQLQEVMKILLGQGDLLRNRMLYMDAESASVNILKIGG